MAKRAAFLKCGLEACVTPPKGGGARGTRWFGSFSERCSSRNNAARRTRPVVIVMRRAGTGRYFTPLDGPRRRAGLSLRHGPRRLVCPVGFSLLALGVAANPGERFTLNHSPHFWCARLATRTSRAGDERSMRAVLRCRIDFFGGGSWPDADRGLARKCS